MKNDFRIPRATVEGMDDGSLFWALIEPIWPDTEVDELQRIAQGTPGQRAFYATTLFMRETDNGGVEQFFYNSSGMYLQFVLEGFRVLEAFNHLGALHEAMSLFPEGIVPLDRDDRIRAVEKIPKDRFEPMNGKLYGEERLWPIFRKYLKEHPEEFFKD
jgi:hypothetical protein